MGQYYRIVNIDKNEVIKSFDFGNGQKLTEWSYCKNRMCLAMLNLLAGEWKGDRVYVIGDYADDSGGECWVPAFRAIGNENIYGDAYDFLHRIPKNRRLCEFRGDFSNTKAVSIKDNGYRYIINHALGVYIDLEHCPLQWVWFDENGRAWPASLFPLSLLLAMGNGRGGGDYRGENAELCGAWCDTVASIEVSKEQPLGMTEFCPDFHEGEFVPWNEKKSYIRRERAKRKEL